MALPVRLNKAVLALFLAHLAISSYHAWSHRLTAVPLSNAQSIFIAVVVVAAPIVAVILLLRKNLTTGYLLFSAAMLGSFAFGAYFHFLFDSPDLYSNVHNPGAGHFRLSAVLLAVVEFLGFWWAAVCYARTIHSKLRA